MMSVAIGPRTFMVAAIAHAIIAGDRHQKWMDAPIEEVANVAVAIADAIIDRMSHEAVGNAPA